MPQDKKQTAGDAPLAQQRDERGRGTKVQQERLGDVRPDREPAPKLPHERDETTGDESTSGVANQESQDVLRQAREDIESGKQDTDRGPVMDEAYRKQKR